MGSNFVSRVAATAFALLGLTLVTGCGGGGISSTTGSEEMLPGRSRRWVYSDMGIYTSLRPDVERAQVNRCEVLGARDGHAAFAIHEEQPQGISMLGPPSLLSDSLNSNKALSAQVLPLAKYQRWYSTKAGEVDNGTAPTHIGVYI